MAERTIAVNSVSKTFSVTGWRIGFIIASAELTASIRKVHDFLTVGAAAPLQEACAEAFAFPDSYYKELSAFYRERRDYLLGALEEVGFRCVRPGGAYYIMAEIEPFGWDDDVAFAFHLASEVGVAVVPGSSFYRPGHPDAAKYVRFCFCKEMSTLEAAVANLKKLKRK